MVRRLNGRLPWLVACAAVLSLALGSPALAQSTGMIRGVVKDAAGKPVEGAKVNIDAEANNRHFDTKSDKKGEFLQIGLAPGAYKVTAEKDKVVSPPSPVTVRIASRQSDHAGARRRRRRRRRIAGSGGEERGAEEDVRGRRDREPRRQSRRRDRRASWRAAELNPNCFDCYYNIAFSRDAEEGLRQGRSRLQEGDRAQGRLRRGLQRPGQHLQRAAQVRPGGHGEREGDGVERQRRRRRAAGGGNADAMFNQGVILWNAGKIAEAKKQFEGAVAANPNHAESHYQLGMALVNEGNLAGAATEFETYLKLAPTGPNAATAKGILGSAEEVVIDRCCAPGPAGRRSRAHRAGRRPGRARPRLHPPHRRLQNLPRRVRARRRRRRPDRLRREQGPGSAARRWTQTADLPLRWHLVGHLQSNKAKKAAPLRRGPLGRRRAALVDEARRGGRARRDAGLGSARPGGSRRRSRPSTARAKTSWRPSSTAARSPRSCRLRRADAAAAGGRRSRSGPAVFPRAARAARAAAGRGVDASMLAGAVHGHEPRFRGGGRRRGDPGARRNGDFRRTATYRPDPGDPVAKASYRPISLSGENDHAMNVSPLDLRQQRFRKRFPRLRPGRGRPRSCWPSPTTTSRRCAKPTGCART